MHKKLSLKLKDIQSLNHETLARLVAKEARSNKAFKNAVLAAKMEQNGDLASLTDMIQQQIKDIKQDQTIIFYDKVNAFCKKLRKTVDLICNNLAQLSPDKAIDCLLAFVQTYCNVYERVEGGDSAIDGVYHDTLSKLQTIMPKLSDEQCEALSQKINQKLKNNHFEHFEQAFYHVYPFLSANALRQWDKQIQDLYHEHITTNKDLWWYKNPSDEVIELRAIIALALNKLGSTGEA